MGEIHELCVSALSLVWFAGATPEPSALAILLTWQKSTFGAEANKC